MKGDLSMNRLRGVFAKHALFAFVVSAFACFGASASNEAQAPQAGKNAGSLQFIAGSVDGRDAVDGVGAAARFADNEVSTTLNRPGIAVDKAGNVFVADLGNQIIRKVSPGGAVTTIAGLARARGDVDGPAADARFNDPAGIAVDGSGNLYVADSANHCIRKISPAGVVSTLAGDARSPGFADGSGRDARFKDPQGIALDSAGNLFVADISNQAIRRVTPQGTVTTVAGNAAHLGDQDGHGTSAQLNYPFGLAIDRLGNVYVTQVYGERVRKVSPAGDVTTLMATVAQKTWGEPIGAEARWAGAAGIAMARDGSLLVASTDHHRIRRISPAGAVSNVAGPFDKSAAWGYRDGMAASSRFYEPTSVAVDASGNLLVFDAGNASLRKLDASGMVTTVAGKARNRLFSLETADGQGAHASFAFQSVVYALAALAADDHQTIYVAEPHTYTVRKIDRDGTVSTLAGARGISGAADGIGSQARFALPVGVAADSHGNVFVADSNNFAIRKIEPGGAVTTFAGALGKAGSVDGRGTEARFNAPVAIAVDKTDNLYVSDYHNGTIRKIDPGGTVTTLAGKASEHGLRDGAGDKARFEKPSELAVDRAGNVYVVDGNIERRVRRVTPQGDVTTPSSSEWKRSSAIPASTPSRPDVFSALAFDDRGRLYIVEATHHVVWRVDASGQVDIAAGDVHWPGQTTGPLPGRLDHPSGLAYLGRNQLAVTSGNAVFRLALPSGD